MRQAAEYIKDLCFLSSLAFCHWRNKMKHQPAVPPYILNERLPPYIVIVWLPPIIRHYFGFPPLSYMAESTLGSAHRPPLWAFPPLCYYGGIHHPSANAPPMAEPPNTHILKSAIHPPMAEWQNSNENAYADGRITSLIRQLTRPVRWIHQPMDCCLSD